MNRQNPNRSVLRDGHALSVYGLKLADALTVGVTGALAYALRFGEADLLEPVRYLYALLAGVLLALVVFSELGVYRTWRAGARSAMYGRLLLGWAVMLGMLASLSFFSKTGAGFSRLWFVYWAGIGLVGLILVRLLARELLRILHERGLGVRRVAIIGPPDTVGAVNQRAERLPWAGFKVVALYTPDSPAQQSVPDPLLRTSHLEALAASIDADRIDEIWLTWPMREEARIRQVIELLGDSSVNIRWIPDIFSFRLINHGVTELAGMPMLDLSVTPMSGINRLVKEMEDKVLSGLILLMISPILLVLAIGVKLSSPGPVFYRQERIGWNNRPFMMLKFRSMPVDTEAGGVRWGSAQTKAISPFGRFIRKTSLDELPQFINVLKGDMSIVGPRPERTIFVHQFKNQIPNYMKKHMVKAGITGWAQIHGLRGDTDLAKRIEYDLHYIEHWSVWFDLRIIAQTALKMFFDRSAY